MIIKWVVLPVERWQDATVTMTWMRTVHLLRNESYTFPRRQFIFVDVKNCVVVNFLFQIAEIVVITTTDVMSCVFFFNTVQIVWLLENILASIQTSTKRINISSENFIFENSREELISTFECTRNMRSFQVIMWTCVGYQVHLLYVKS